MNITDMHKKIFAGMLLFAFVVMLAASVYIQQVQSEFALLTRLKIAEQETKLATIAEITDGDKADATVAAIIKDCSLENRGRFDELLARLSELNATELKDIEQLFNACGNFFAVQKAVMVTRLQHEYDVYVDLIEILTLVDKKADTIVYNHEGWKRLVDLETKRSVLSTHLVNIQGDIIRALISKVTIASDDMQELLVSGQKTKDDLFLISTEIDDLRAQIQAL